MPAASISTCMGQPSFMLEARDPVLYYIQRLRDEAHRFAIGSHRARRSKAIGVNPLDEIAGIGPTRKKALLQSFRFGQGRGPGQRHRSGGSGGGQHGARAGYLRPLP